MTGEDVTATPGVVLVVDDNAMDRAVLAKAVGNLGYTVRTATDGWDAVAQLQCGGVDVVLLDLEMPSMDGFQTLREIKSDATLGRIPVIVVSAVEDHASLVRCIELGATDYLYKPANRELLRVRLSTSLATKRLRDLEHDYLEQVQRVIAAAQALESDAYDPAALTPVAARDDALGTLARMFDQMAREVQTRQDRLRRQVAELRIEIDRGRVGAQAAEVTGSAYYRRLADEAASLKRILTGEAS